jgi:hypothetical protein
MKKLLLLFVVNLGAIFSFATNGDDDPNDNKGIEDKIDDIAQEQYHMKAKELPREMIAAILVNLDTEELVAASEINKEWRELALRIMKDTLLKSLVNEKHYDTDEKLLTQFKYLKLCPKFKDKEDVDQFIRSLADAKKHGANHYKFSLADRNWFFRVTEYKDFEPTIKNLYISKYAATSGLFLIDEKIKYNFVDLVSDNHGNRVRCYYTADTWAWGSGKHIFNITTFLDNH